MVVVHRQHHIKFTRVLSGISGTHEHGIRRKSAFNVHSQRFGLGNGRVDDLDLFAPKDAAFACMRVEPGDGNARCAVQIFGQRLMRDAQRLQNLRRGHGLDRVHQRDMNAHQHGAQFVVGQHHAHRHLRNGQARMGSSLRLQQLRMAGKAHARQVQRLFVQRCRHHGGNLPLQCGLGSPGHALRCRMSSRSGNLAIGLRPSQTRQIEQRNRACRHGERLGRVINHSDRLGHAWLARGGSSCQRSSAPQRLQLAHHKAAVQSLRLCAKGLGNDFWADTGAVALSNGYDLRHGLACFEFSI